MTRRFAAFGGLLAAAIALGVVLGLRTPGDASEPDGATKNEAAKSSAATGESDPKPRAPSQPDAASKTDAPVKKEVFSGRVVMLPEALKRRGIKSLVEMKD